MRASRGIRCSASSGAAATGVRSRRSVSSTVIAATPSAAWHASRLRRRIEGAPGLGRVDQPAEPADVVLRMARGAADAQTGGAAGTGRKEDSGDIEAAIAKQLGRQIGRA